MKPFLAIISILFYIQLEYIPTRATCVLQKDNGSPGSPNASTNKVVCTSGEVDRPFSNNEKKEESSNEKDEGIVNYPWPRDESLLFDKLNMETTSNEDDNDNNENTDHGMRISKRDGHKFMRFGRDIQHNFMRFGRDNGPVGHKFMRFGRDNEPMAHKFMRFGRSDANNNNNNDDGGEDNNDQTSPSYDDDGDIYAVDTNEPVDDELLQRIAKDVQHNFMRFGRATPEHDILQFGRTNGGGSIGGHSFMRFGRIPEHSFMRFGRSGTHNTLKNNNKRTEHMFMRFGRK